VKIHEYQGKEIFRKFGMPVPRGIPAFSVDEAVKAAQSLGGKVWVVKAQIHAGGRGKGGGVKVAKSLDEVKQRATEILGMQLVTHQTGPGGQKVRRLLVEEGADIRQELYIGMVVDRGTQRVALMASSEGGMDIEAVAANTPEKIHTIFIDPVTGLTDAQADGVARKIGVPDGSVGRREACCGLYKAFHDTDASLAEINPLVVTGDGSVIALDAKLNFDSNALFRHPKSSDATSTRKTRPGCRRSSTCRTSRRRQHRLPGQRRRTRDGDMDTIKLRRRARELPRRGGGARRKRSPRRSR
jgi:succinyl-CoA synthetase beta subunit